MHSPPVTDLGSAEVNCEAKYKGLKRPIPCKVSSIDFGLIVLIPAHPISQAYTIGVRPVQTRRIRQRDVATLRT